MQTRKSFLLRSGIALPKGIMAWIRSQLLFTFHLFFGDKTMLKEDTEPKTFLRAFSEQEFSEHLSDPMALSSLVLQPSRRRYLFGMRSVL